MYQVEELSAMAAGVHNTVVSQHNIHSRTKSPSHGLSKRERSRSRGRKKHSGTATTAENLPQKSNFGKSNASSRFSEGTNTSLGSSNFHRNHYHESDVNTKHVGSINELGRCVRHPHIELCCRGSAASPWIVLLQECPLCSLDLSKFHNPAEVDKVILDGASSSQPSTSTTNRTSVEEESSVKSWAMSDVSSVDRESKCNNSGAPSSSSSRGCEALLKRRTPPPPPRGASTKHVSDSTMGNPSMESSYNPKIVSNPLQLLKELGRKFVIESEISAAAGGGAARAFSLDDVQLPIELLPKRPPPPPYVRRNQTPASYITPLENSKTGLSQVKRQQQQICSSHISSRRSSSAVDGANESIIVEASGIIARMESLTQGESTTFNKSRVKSYRSKQQTDLVGEEDSVEIKAAEKLARIQRQKERALKHAAKLIAQEQQRQIPEHGGGGAGASQPMTDPTTSTTRRGRDGPRTSDILLEAAQIRDRARRSASRSRERLKAAAIFCGETPPVDNYDWDGQLEDNRELLAAERKRSILNPHGSEEQPIPPAIERRSQSMERKWSGSDTRFTVESGGVVYDSNEDVVTEEKRHHGCGGRDRSASLPRSPHQQSVAEDLLTRRRDMRQKIVEMKSSAQSRTEHRRTLGTEQTEEYYPSNDEEECERYPRNIESATRGRPSERRRGRSRSAVRDGYSKIRSSSLNVFRKKEVKSTDLDDEVRTVDSGRMSMASLQHMISRCRPRSLSLSRRRRNNQSDVADSWLTDSENSMVDKRRGSFGSYEVGYGDFDGRSAAKSEIGTIKSFLSTSSFNNFLSKKKPPIDSGLVGSLSRSQEDAHEGGNSRCTK